MLTLQKIFYFSILTPVLICLGATAEPADDWSKHFQYQYDYTLQEDAGLDREAEPVHVTLSAKEGEVEDWQKEVRVLRLEGDGEYEIIPFQAYGGVKAVVPQEEEPTTISTNIVFIATCDAKKNATYRLLWDNTDSATLPEAYPKRGLLLRGEAPGLYVENEFYRMQLSGKCGAIETAYRAGQGADCEMSIFQKIPTHFVADVWSPPQRWDHDYDWDTPPHQEVIIGPLMVEYHRWGPMSLYKDVEAHLTYTFYAGVPYVQVRSLMQFNENRSARAVRLGEIVTTHLETKKHQGNRAEPLIPTFTHYAWPEHDKVITREINAHLNDDNEVEIEGYAKGAIAILDRDVPWVAGYHKSKEFGIASLRKSHFVMNKEGGPIPFTVPCTYVAQYGWGFSYWSRPEVYPFGEPNTILDRNAVVAKGTVFCNEEALFVFEPSSRLHEVRDAHQRFNNPLKLKFKGTGPW